jgi:hypothetical protein
MSEDLALIPKGVQYTVSWALGTLREWNAAIWSCRQGEQLSGCPGRYEWELRYAASHAGQRDNVQRALGHLATFEYHALRNGVDADAAYVALGGYEALIEERPAVRAFRPPIEEPRHEV